MSATLSRCQWFKQQSSLLYDIYCQMSNIRHFNRLVAGVCFELHSHVTLVQFRSAAANSLHRRLAFLASSTQPSLSKNAYLGILFGQEERPPRGQLWMEQCLTSLKYWPIFYTIWAHPNYTWGLAILADSLLFPVNNILAGLWLNCICSVEITLFVLANILLQYRALFQC